MWDARKIVIYASIAGCHWRYTHILRWHYSFPFAFQVFLYRKYRRVYFIPLKGYFHTQSIPKTPIPPRFSLFPACRQTGLYLPYLPNPMSQSTIIITIIALGSFLLGYMLAKMYFLTQLRQHRRDAVSRSKSVISGHVHEKLAPLLPDFPYAMRDMVFIGKGVDYIIFDGLSSGQLNEIIFLEIKSWSSKQNANEKAIQHSIEKGKVSYEVMRI